MTQLEDRVAAGLVPTRLQAVERAAADLRRGLAVLIRDGGHAAFVLAAELVSADSLSGLRALGPVNVLLTHQRAQTLKIRLYTSDAVAVRIDESMDAATVRHLADPTADLNNPLSGPFRAVRKQLSAPALSALALVKLAELLPAALIVEGADADFQSTARTAGLLSFDGKDVQAHGLQKMAALARVTQARVPLAGVENAEIVAFRAGPNGSEELAIIIGNPDPGGKVLVRLHSACFTGDLLGSLRCDCGDQLRAAIARMAEEGGGILLYLAQEGRGIGLLNKLRAYELQEQGFDTHEANERLGFAADERLFGTAAQILKMLGVGKVRLMTNNPAKAEALAEQGIQIVERVPLIIPANVHNRRYLDAKAKAGHQL